MSRTIPLCPIPRLSGGGPPVLAINWIERGMGVVPTEFQVLLEQVVDALELKGEIGKLIEARRRGEELDRGPRIAPISEFIESELARLENKRFEREYYRPTAPVDEFNDLFRLAIDEVWARHEESHLHCTR